MAKKNSTSKTKPEVKANDASKSRVSYKKKYDAALIKIKNLEISLIEAKTQNEININSFQEKAKGFQAKAQKEVDKIKKTLTKNTQTQTTHFKKYAAQELLETSLEILLNLELAIKTGEKNEAVQAYVVGFKMLITQFYDNLSNYGVIRIKPKIGANFKPEIHHAVETTKGHKNKIVAIKRDGFMLHDRVLKPALVVIGK